MKATVKEGVIIFPHQLFEHNELCTKDRTIFIVEHPRYFTDFDFHKKKLMLHRASMQYYADYLNKKKLNVIYITIEDDLYKTLKKHKIATVHYYDPVYTVLEKELSSHLKKLKIEAYLYETPAFISPIDWLDQIFKGKKSYLMGPFYIKQRKRLKILVSSAGKPTGGKWTYDAENREKMPASVKIPAIKKPRANTYTKEAARYIDKHFKKNPGDSKNFFYPVTHSEAKSWLSDFLAHRLSYFGIYQDAMVPGESFLFHSVLSPLINNGLLTPEYVITETLSYAKKHKVPLNSLEGFIRQIIGWREFVRAVYVYAGEKQRSSNFFKHKRKIHASFWDGTTTLVPVDDAIKSALNTAYAHHIERLMVLGNCMLLCEYSPDSVYEWFMALFIDAYDWVMVPNVYGMSQYADGGMMTTKPYISSSNYIKKMSSYKSGEWCSIWDGLYWRFILKHKTVIQKNNRLKIMASFLNRMDKETLSEHITCAESYLKSLK